VAIPFFRKGKDKPQGVAQRATPEVAAGPATTQWGDPLGPNSGIIVEESSGAPQTAVDEAAILYASGQADMAETTLRNILGSQDRRAWNMLFDLYRVQNREKEFEQLALDYAMQFETSPPVWQKIGGAAKSAPASQAKAEASSLELPGLLDKAAADKLGDELAAPAANAQTRIDFSRIEMIDEAGASECTLILEKARKAKRRLQVSGVDRLIALLKDLNRATHSRPAHWLFLLELYQTLGKEEAFEDLAVDYAVRFEVSPPSWIAVQGAEVVQAPAVESASAGSEIEMLALAGEITPATESTLQKFCDYAASHDPVVVDLAQVTRVDYASVSKLISTLMQCLGSGKTITLRGHNALIHELFRVMGIDQLVQLVPHHPD
jgi:ABC-type transporter Mla MlaB component